MPDPTPPPSDKLPTAPIAGAPVKLPTTASPAPVVTPPATPVVAAPVTPAATPPTTPPAAPLVNSLLGADPVAPPPVEPAPIEDLGIVFPEGVNVDAAALHEFTVLAKEVGLTKETAQKLVDYQTKQNAQASAAFDAQREAWRASITATPEGVASVADARKVIAKYAPEGTEMRTLLTESWMGDHPAVISLLAAIGRDLGEGKISVKSSGKALETPGARSIFPSMANP